MPISQQWFFSHLQIVTYVFFRVRECLVVLHSKVLINCFSIQKIILRVMFLTKIRLLCSQQGLYKSPHSRNSVVNKYSSIRWLEVPSFQRHIWMNMERPTRWPLLSENGILELAKRPLVKPSAFLDEYGGKGSPWFLFHQSRAWSTSHQLLWLYTWLMWIKWNLLNVVLSIIWNTLSCF